MSCRNLASVADFYHFVSLRIYETKVEVSRLISPLGDETETPLSPKRNTRSRISNDFKSWTWHRP